MTLEGVSKEGVVQPSPTFLAPGTSFTKIKCVTFIVHFISIIVTSAPRQIIRHQILEAGELFS